jgi:hypothetical protein
VHGAISRIGALLLGAIAAGALTAGYVGALPQNRARAPAGDDVRVEFRGDLKSIRVEPRSSVCATARPEFPFEVRPFERSIVHVEVSSELSCVERGARVDWKIVSAPRSASDAPEALMLTYEYRHKDGRLTCSFFSKDLSCSIRDDPPTALITGR